MLNKFLERPLENVFTAEKRPYKFYPKSQSRQGQKLIKKVLEILSPPLNLILKQDPAGLLDP